MKESYFKIFTDIVIEAEKNNWDFFCWKERSGYLSWQITGKNEGDLKLNILVKQQNRIVHIPYSVYDVVFNIGFASSLFGNKLTQPDNKKGYQPNWKIHLPLLSLFPNKLEYFRK